MPRIPLYNRQVGVQAAGAPQIRTPVQSTDSQMLQQGVNSFADAAVRLAQQQNAVKNTQNLSDFVNAQNGLNEALTQAQQQSKTGIDYIPMAQGLIKQHQEDFFSSHPGMTDQEKGEYSLRWAQAGGQIENQAINWGQNQAHQIKVSNLEDTASQIGARLLQDPTGSQALQQSWVQDVTNSDLPPAMKAELQQKGINQWEYAKGLWAANNASEHLSSKIASWKMSGSSGTLADSNNNPLNVRYSGGNNWLGKGGDNGSGFEQFDTPEHGLRAGLKLMRNHINNGDDTLNSLINRWAPSSDNNNPAQYAQAVSKATGIPSDAKLNPNDPQQMMSVARAMAKQEGYGENIDDGQINRAWNAVDNPGTLATGVNLGHLSMEQMQSLHNMSMANINRAQAFAIAQQNHEDMLSARREKAATHAYSTMQMRLANGEIPTQEDWQNYTQIVQGTGYNDSSDLMRHVMVETQRLYGMTPVQAQEEIDRMHIDLRKNGGSEMDYKVLKALETNNNQRRSDLQSNPQAVGALDSGQALQPLSSGDALAQPGVWGQGLVQRQINSDAILQKYGPTAGKNLLTPDELNNTKDSYARMTPDQRIQFWRNTQASSSTPITARLAREMGGDSLQVAAVAGLANTPNGYSTALTIDNGYRLLHPTDGASKVKVAAGFDDQVVSSIKDEYPSLSISQVQQLASVVKAYHVGSGESTEIRPDIDSLHKVIGTKIKVSGADVIAPPGENANVYKDAINNGINQLGQFAQSARNGLNQKLYALAPDSEGNQALVNAATFRPIIGESGKPIVIEVNR